MITALILGVITNFITYNIALYIGMKKGANTAKKVYREFGVFLPDNLKDKL